MFSNISPESRRLKAISTTLYMITIKCQKTAEQPAVLSILSLFACHQYSHFAS